MSRLIGRLAAIIVRRRWATLVLCVLVTAMLMAGAGGLSIVIDPDKSLPQDHPFTVATQLAERAFASRFTVVIGLTPATGNALQPAVIAAVRGVTEALAQDAGVVRGNLASLTARRVKDIAGSEDGLEVRPLLAQAKAGGAALAAVLARNPVYDGLLLSRDRRTAAVVADFRYDPGGFKAIAARVRATVAPFASPDLEISVAGQPIFLGLTETYSQRMAFLFPLALLIIGLIHYEAFRSWQGLVLPLVTGLVATGWALGIMGWTRTPLDAFNVSTPILILAVAAGHAVQILKRYYEEYRAAFAASPGDPHAANRDAIVRTLATTGPVMVAAGLTAVASFSSLLVFRIETIRTFGLFTALGIGSALILELTLIPALRAILPPPGARHMAREGADRLWERLAVWLARATTRNPGLLLAAALAVVVVAAAGAAQIRVDNSLRSYFLASVRERQEDSQLNARLAGDNVLQVIVRGREDDAIKRPDVLRAMAATQRFLEGEAAVGKTVSLVDFIRQIDRAMTDDGDPARPLPASHDLPASRELIAQYLLLYSMSGDPTDFDSLVDSGYRTAVVTAYLKEESSAYLLGLDRRLRAFVQRAFPPDVDILIGGHVLSPVALNEVLVSNKLINIAQIACAVFLVSSLLFRSLLGGLMVLVPLALAALVNFGLMGWFGIPLQVATASVSAIAVGIGADYAIYLLYRLREEAHATSPDIAIERALGSAGKAVMFVATAIAGGYSVLMLSWGFLVHFWIGLLISVAMLTSAAAALTILPALAARLRPRFLFPGLALGLLAAVPARAEPLSADEVMRRNFVASKPDDSTSDATFALIAPDGQQRTRTVHTWTRLREDGSSEMRLTRFVGPADVRGTATLTIENGADDDDIWIYLPALRKVRRLVASNRRDSYVGTDFSYGDIIGLKVEDWHHAIVGRETVDGAPCFVVESTPARPDVVDASGYGRRRQWIRADTFVTVRGEYADASGKPLKEFHATDFRAADPQRNRWQAMRLEMRDLQSNHSTVISLENYRGNQKLDAALFSARLLDREQ